MPKKKRKKYPKLPSGFGTIRYLGSGRRNCYAVHPPAVVDALGRVQRPAALCYVDDWVKGFTVLTAYKAGSYEPGMEKKLEVAEASDADVLVQRLIADYSTIKGVEDKHPEIKELTFSEVYEKFYHWKFEENKGKPLSERCKESYRTAFGNSKSIHDRLFKSIKHEDLQKVIDDCQKKSASKNQIVNLFKQMYKYAIIHEICTEDKSQYVSSNCVDDVESGTPFTPEEFSVLWNNKDDEDVQMILIMCYSGFRISEYRTMEINLEKRYFHGGIKTDAGKNRYVPIHHAIYPFVVKRLEKYGCMLNTSSSSFRRCHFYRVLDRLNIQGSPKHTPHDCRHTFSAMCESYKIELTDRKRMLGHSLKEDVTTGTYGHRSIEELRAEIEKIKAPLLSPICDQL